MWLFTPEGFYSIVDKHDPEHQGELCIRARASKDLDNLRDTFLPELGETIVNAGTDYPFRAWAPRALVQAAVSQMVFDLHYDNFKNEVAEVQGYDRAHVYGGVWTQMLKLEKEGVIDYPTNPYNFPEEGPVVVKRDGEQLVRLETPNDAFIWLIRNQGQSVAYATTYGGYTVEKEES